MNRRLLFLIVCLSAALVSFLLLSGGNKNYLALLIFPEKITPESLIEEYQSGGKIKILVVPGHDNEVWGTEFRGMKEADLNLEAGKELFSYFKNDPRFEVFISRDENGYTGDFTRYFSDQSSEISEFKNRLQNFFRTAIWAGLIKPKESNNHAGATNETSLKLYGINKWAGDNGVDIVINLHFNDYAERKKGKSGVYSGFSVYIPEKQLQNHRASLAIAESVYGQLKKYLAPSDLPLEKKGIIEDQELIATGSNASLDSAGLLVEYGYIYQKEFTDPSVGPALVKELALETYAGVKKYFESGFEIPGFKTSLLPHSWQKPLSSEQRNADVLALQAALISENAYNCQLSGYFGKCTEKGVLKFQKKRGLAQSGVADKDTLAKLNEIYGKTP